MLPLQTFKANWEKTHTQHHLTNDLIKKMLKVVYPDNPIQGFEVIEKAKVSGTNNLESSCLDLL